MSRLRNVECLADLCTVVTMQFVPPFHFVSISVSCTWTLDYQADLGTDLRELTSYSIDRDTEILKGFGMNKTNNVTTKKNKETKAFCILFQKPENKAT